MTDHCSGCGGESPFDSETIVVDGLWVMEMRHAINCADCDEVWSGWYNPVNGGGWHDRSRAEAFRTMFAIQRVYAAHPHLEAEYRIRKCGDVVKEVPYLQMEDGSYLTGKIEDGYYVFDDGECTADCGVVLDKMIHVHDGGEDE